MKMNLGPKGAPTAKEHRAILAKNILNTTEDRPTSARQSKAKQPVQLKEKVMSRSKQPQVSEAAANSKIVKRTKKLMKIVVSGVKIAGETRKVRFVARADKGIVVARSPGFPALRIFCEQRRNREVFGVRVGREVILGGAPTPNKAFARGVSEVWATM